LFSAKFSSVNRRRKYVMLRVASDRTQYPTSVDDRETDGCSLLNHAMGAEPNLYRIPEVERRELGSPIQSASIKVSKLPGLLEG
jgi:hypothetical protein